MDENRFKDSWADIELDENSKKNMLNTILRENEKISKNKSYKLTAKIHSIKCNFSSKRVSAGVASVLVVVSAIAIIATQFAVPQLTQEKEIMRGVMLSQSPRTNLAHIINMLPEEERDEDAVVVFGVCAVHVSGNSSGFTYNVGVENETEDPEKIVVIDSFNASSEKTGIEAAANSVVSEEPTKVILKNVENVGVIESSEGFLIADFDFEDNHFTLTLKSDEFLKNTTKEELAALLNNFIMQAVVENGNLTWLYRYYPEYVPGWDFEAADDGKKLSPGTEFFNALTEELCENLNIDSGTNY